MAAYVYKSDGQPGAVSKVFLTEYADFIDNIKEVLDNGTTDATALRKFLSKKAIKAGVLNRVSTNAYEVPTPLEPDGEYLLNIEIDTPTNLSLGVAGVVTTITTDISNVSTTFTVGESYLVKHDVATNSFIVKYLMNTGAGVATSGGINTLDHVSSTARHKEIFIGNTKTFTGNKIVCTTSPALSNYTASMTLYLSANTVYEAMNIDIVVTNNIKTILITGGGTNPGVVVGVDTVLGKFFIDIGSVSNLSSSSYVVLHSVTSLSSTSKYSIDLDDFAGLVTPEVISYNAQYEDTALSNQMGFETNLDNISDGVYSYNFTGDYVMQHTFGSTKLQILTKYRNGVLPETTSDFKFRLYIDGNWTGYNEYGVYSTLYDGLKTTTGNTYTLQDLSGLLDAAAGGGGGGRNAVTDALLPLTASVATFVANSNDALTQGQAIANFITLSTAVGIIHLSGETAYEYGRSLQTTHVYSSIVGNFHNNNSYIPTINLDFNALTLTDHYSRRRPNEKVVRFKRLNDYHGQTMSRGGMTRTATLDGFKSAEARIGCLDYNNVGSTYLQPENYHGVDRASVTSGHMYPSIGNYWLNSPINERLGSNSRKDYIIKSVQGPSTVDGVRVSRKSFKPTSFIGVPNSWFAVGDGCVVNPDSIRNNVIQVSSINDETTSQLIDAVYVIVDDRHEVSGGNKLLYKGSTSGIPTAAVTSFVEDTSITTSIGTFATNPTVIDKIITTPDATFIFYIINNNLYMLSRGFNGGRFGTGVTTNTATWVDSGVIFSNITGYLYSIRDTEIVIYEKNSDSYKISSGTRHASAGSFVPLSTWNTEQSSNSKTIVDFSYDSKHPMILTNLGVYVGDGTSVPLGTAPMSLFTPAITDHPVNNASLIRRNRNGTAFIVFTPKRNAVTGGVYKYGTHNTSFEITTTDYDTPTEDTFFSAHLIRVVDMFLTENVACVLADDGLIHYVGEISNYLSITDTLTWDFVGSNVHLYNVVRDRNGSCNNTFILSSEEDMEYYSMFSNIPAKHSTTGWYSAGRSSPIDLVRANLEVNLQTAISRGENYDTNI